MHFCTSLWIKASAN
uniref:Uncharacterized protein n=1 Tax=Anguilla anguilla TaxID=7936 RepID=A0A0E9RPC1_ANGAN